VSVEPRETPELSREDGAPRDGIGEEDNAIPAWWWWTFVGTILFAAFYIPFYTLSGWSQERQYEAQAAAVEAELARARPSVPDTNPYRGDPEAIAEGQQVFATICAACHKPDGTGLVGPSLVDPYWKYGSSDHDRFESVSEGRPGGMPPWEPQLGSEKIWKVLAYVDTLPRSDEPGVGAPGVAAPGAAAGTGAPGG
jgi:cytochrome c oxidase cbb3-type subunit 3